MLRGRVCWPGWRRLISVLFLLSLPSLFLLNPPQLHRFSPSQLVQLPSLLQPELEVTVEPRPAAPPTILCLVLTQVSRNNQDQS